MSKSKNTLDIDVGMSVMWGLCFLGVVNVSVALFHLFTTNNNAYSQLEFIMILDGISKMFPAFIATKSSNPEHGFPLFFAGFIFSCIFPFFYWLVSEQVYVMTENSVFQLWAYINVYFVTVIVHYTLISICCLWFLFVLTEFFNKKNK